MSIQNEDNQTNLKQDGVKLFDKPTNLYYGTIVADKNYEFYYDASEDDQSKMDIYKEVPSIKLFVSGQYLDLNIMKLVMNGTPTNYTLGSPISNNIMRLSGNGKNFSPISLKLRQDPITQAGSEGKKPNYTDFVSQEIPESIFWQVNDQCGEIHFTQDEGETVNGEFKQTTCCYFSDDRVCLVTKHDDGSFSKIGNGSYTRW